MTDESLARSNSQSTRRMGSPMLSLSKSTSTKRPSTITWPGNSTYPTPYGSKCAPAKGGLGAKPWIVHVHNEQLPPRWRSPTSVDAHRAHDLWDGKATLPQALQADPMRN